MTCFHTAGIAVVSKGTVEFAGENIAGQPAYAIVRKGLALSPEGWRLFTQQSVENNLLLGATPLADRGRITRQFYVNKPDRGAGAQKVVDLLLERKGIASA